MLSLWKKSDGESSVRGVLLENGSFAKTSKVVVAAAFGAASEHVESDEQESRSVAIVSHPIVTMASAPETTRC